MPPCDRLIHSNSCSSCLLFDGSGVVTAASEVAVTAVPSDTVDVGETCKQMKRQTVHKTYSTDQLPHPTRVSLILCCYCIVCFIVLTSHIAV